MGEHRLGVEGQIDALAAAQGVVAIATAGGRMQGVKLIMARDYVATAGGRMQGVNSGKGLCNYCRGRMQGVN